MDRRQPRVRTGGWIAIAIILLALTAGYVVLLRQFKVSELPVEERFGAEAPAGEVYLEPAGVDALNQGMQLRAYLQPSLPEGKDGGPASGRDMTLLITHDKTVEELRLPAGGQLVSSTFEVDLNDGSVADYPLDAYTTRLNVALLDRKSSVRLPARITVWEGALGYDLKTSSRAGADPDEVELTTSIARSGAFMLFALCAYGAMIVLGVCAIIVAVLTYIEAHPPETSLIGSLAAIAFALPVLRNTLPGSPPLGVLADMWVFLWAELATVLALALVVFKWTRAALRA
jgi:hypothetical protein